MSAPGPSPWVVVPYGSSTVGRLVRQSDLRIGERLAEGGEGRVFEVPRQPHFVYKAYRRPRPRQSLEDLIAWSSEGLRDQARAQTLAASAAWPAAVVVGDTDDDGALGLLLPRAPRRFALRHRDGTTRLASLSYLTADPAHRAVAYGLDLPAPVSAMRIGLVYALARLLDVFEHAGPSVGHGDLSTKNVLWSLQRGPEIFVIDCDNSELFDESGRPLGESGRRRAMTPNWDDPAVSNGSNPGVTADRYSLALIFLRIVGAANFPVQASQRDGGDVTVDFAVPAPAFTRDILGPGSTVWDLCERGLSVAHPEGRPPPSAWVETLEGVLEAMRARPVLAAVRSAQGGGYPVTGGHPQLEAGDERDVTIRPVCRSDSDTARWDRLHPVPAARGPWDRPYAVLPVVGGQVGGPLGSSGPGSYGSPAVPSSGNSGSGPGAAGSDPGVATKGQPILPQVVAYVRLAVGWLVGLHRRTANQLFTPGQRNRGLRALGFCVATDLTLAVAAIFLVAMMAAPILGV